MIELGPQIEPEDRENLKRLTLGVGGVDSIQNPPKDEGEKLIRRQAAQDRYNEDAWARLHPGRPQKITIWDRESWNLLGQQTTASGLMVRLGNVPIVRDIQPERSPWQEQRDADREAKARAGHCGDCGDM